MTLLILLGILLCFSRILLFRRSLNGFLLTCSSRPGMAVLSPNVRFIHAVMGYLYI